MSTPGLLAEKSAVHVNDLMPPGNPVDGTCSARPARNVLPAKDGFVSVTKAPLLNAVVALAVPSNVMSASGTLRV
jgi:hypothetical protein